VPSVNVVLLHADAAELARVLVRRAVRPLLLAADHPESLKYAYASCKLLMQRTGLATFDLVLTASARSPRLAGIVSSLRGVADSFIGALVGGWALVDPSQPAGSVEPFPNDDPGATSLAALLAAQLAMDIEAPAPGAGVDFPSAAPRRGPSLPTDRG
jgi:flagellar biosynthesis protein FlhG